MTVYKDELRHQGLRAQLVKQLREKGITDEKVLEAIQTIPRHYFFDNAFEKIAYEDRAFPIAAGQTISQPYTVAYQTQLLQVKRNEKVLEIGTGSGYQTAILAALGARVCTIERQKELFDTIQKSYPFQRQYPGIRFFYGDGFLGLPTFAPFDKILITAAAPFTPPILLEQLKPGGVMVLPRDEGDSQRMIRITKQADGTLREECFDQFSFVPMLAGKNSGGNKIV
ncbi:MAG: protein-L-isoaspartate(D-aspartate) O-methyltransferase [Chitinophagaceae bacterium]|jgi:protein-L-isoaspartate(D-aspartate) O-methyltransferase|nr:protein-L-isoaspartate(D-aspartate) O-methyltransferase [Chitinophagaceae bacterium]MCA6474070.1 protein-L-isoaspartate(D-aspartate) O-methyltransferase [Chitinophagaceae bacterium]MCA6474963.1 protein-L-isoaspartate(D-aspartate) O-methyltransferase [Chitinophagaceae bacterium]MCA6480109.1 protein-L-isoaspartate(D-aspartate) O-methyltransferase [Chitinophagaceae bacterium]MCA6482233.1 protein-L-isoaspartate(D-aspartate) O-methyltransferase [Chitinophagaceae bacterium]